MPIHKAWVASCAHPRCKTKPLLLYEQFFRTDLRTAERMAREAGWLKVADEWYCGAKHAAVAFLEVKRARSVKRAPRAKETRDAPPAAPAEVAVAPAHVTEETLASVAADGRDG